MHLVKQVGSSCYASLLWHHRLLLGATPLSAFQSEPRKAVITPSSSCCLCGGRARGRALVSSDCCLLIQWSVTMQGQHVVLFSSCIKGVPVGQG